MSDVTKPKQSIGQSYGRNDGKGNVSCQTRVIVTALILLATLCVCGFTKDAKTPLYVGGLWPMTGPGWRGGAEALPAIELAVQVINNSTDILPGHEIRLIWNDTKNSASLGMKLFFDLLYSEPTKVFMIGPCTSRVAEHVSLTATAWNLVHVSYAARSSSMENRADYPFFFRTVPADNAQNPVRLEILKRFGWTKVAMVYQSHDADVYGKTMEELSRELLRRDYTVLTTEAVATDDAERLRLVIARLKSLDARIIFGNFFFYLAKDIFCEAYKQGLVWPRHVWIITELVDCWWEGQAFLTNCTQQEMKESIKYHIALRTVTSTTDGAFNITARTYEKLIGTTNCQYCNYAFDAVMAAGIAMHSVHESGLPLEEFSYTNATYSAAFAEKLTNLSMQGISGPVGFDHSGNRIGQCLVLQAQGGEMVQVGLYDTRSHTLSTDGYAEITWHNDKVPRDSSKTSKLQLYLSDGIFVPMATLACLGMALSLAFLIFNLKFKHLRVIKLSSPMMNNFILLGSVLAYMSVILYGLDRQHLEEKSFEALCTIRLGFLCLGYSVAFGAMFVKTWRVHRIMAKKTTIGITMKMKDIHLVGRILTLVALDIVFIITWASVDPLQMSVTELNSRVDDHDEDHVVVPLVSTCASSFELYWIGAILVYKGVLLLFGIFLAWETRGIHVDALNDSRHIGLCVYNIAVICTIGVPLGFIMGDDNFQGGYVIESLFVMLCTTVTLCIVFLPKVYSVYRNPSGEVDLRFQAGTSRAATAHSSKVLPLQEMTENITIQHRLEKLLKEKDEKIAELRRTLQESDCTVYPAGSPDNPTSTDNPVSTFA